MNTEEKRNFQNALMSLEGMEIEDFDDEREFLDTVYEVTSIDELAAKHGKADEEDNTEFGKVYTWNNAQMVKGLQRGDLKAMATDSGAVMNFTGELEV